VYECCKNCKMWADRPYRNELYGDGYHECLSIPQNGISREQEPIVQTEWYEGPVITDANFHCLSFAAKEN